MARVVVLGTGTGIGKTYVTSALARALRERGSAVLALKPIETGIPEATDSTARDGTDAAQLERAAGTRPTSAHPLYGFAPPISPHLAARLSGRPIDLGAILYWVEQNEVTLHGMAGSSQWLLIESAGGVFSPINADSTNFDLAMALEPAIWVLVAPDCLGVLHDVGAAMLAMRARGRVPDQVVLSVSRPMDASSGTNAAELGRLGIAPVTCVIARDGGDLTALTDALGRWRPCK